MGDGTLGSVIRVSVVALTFSAAGLVALTASESYTDRAVIPVKGDRPTIGFGTTEGVKMGDTITPPRALARAYADINKVEAAGVKRCVKVPLTQYEYDVYVDHSYNVGATAFCESTMVKKLNVLDYAGACAEFPRWYKFQGKDCRIRENKCYGLVTRRAEQQARCEGK